ncbi:MAG: hypothetical protein Q4D42_01050 [Eubacteriales bacterium]|nr:hypothetical protein [Eubacteriales bacterium]
MKCPYCGIHYLDGEKECPVCGKRPGLLSPKKTSKFTQPQQDHSDPPKQKKSSGQSTARKQTYNNKKKSTTAAWQQAAAGQHTHDNPLEKQPSGAKTGCLIVVVLVIILIATSICFAIFQSFAENSSSFDDSNSFLDSDTGNAYNWMDAVDLGTGTWSNADGSITFTIDADGSLYCTTDDTSHTDEYPSCYRLDLNEDNQEIYCLDSELEAFPPNSFGYYEISGYDEDGYFFDCRFYLPANTDTLPDTFDYYDYNTGDFGSFTRVPEEAEPQDATPESATDTPTSDPIPDDTPTEFLPDTPEQRA